MKSEDTIVNEPTGKGNKRMQILRIEPRQEEETPKPADTKGYGGWKQVVIGGVAGILLGSAGTLFTGSTPAKEDEEAEVGGTPEDLHQDSPVATNTTPTTEFVATELPSAKVSDDMSFGEAFAAARAETGAGGIFEWHGGVYGTYYADEWNAMTSEQRLEFGSKVPYGNMPPTGHTDYTDHSSGSGEAQAANEEVQAVSEEAQEVTDEVQVVEAGNDPDDIEVQIVGMENVTMEDGTDATIGLMNVEGHDVYLVDVDGGDFDLMISDMNEDGVIQENEITDIREEGISISEFQQQVDSKQDDLASDSYLADTPDYVNDADISTLV